MTLVLVAILPLMAGVIALFTTLQGKLQRKASAAYADANSLVQESFASIRTVFACTADQRAVQRYSKVRDCHVGHAASAWPPAQHQVVRMYH